MLVFVNCYHLLPPVTTFTTLPLVTFLFYRYIFLMLPPVTTHYHLYHFTTGNILLYNYLIFLSYFTGISNLKINMLKAFFNLIL